MSRGVVRYVERLSRVVLGFLDGHAVEDLRHLQRVTLELGRLPAPDVDAVARYGGKLHLAKDQVLTPEQFRRLYPRYDRLLALKARLDPDGLFATDLARRVGLVDGTP